LINRINGEIKWKVLRDDLKEEFGYLRSENIVKNYWYSKQRREKTKTQAGSDSSMLSKLKNMSSGHVDVAGDEFIGSDDGDNIDEDIDELSDYITPSLESHENVENAEIAEIAVHPDPENIIYSFYNGINFNSTVNRYNVYRCSCLDCDRYCPNPTNTLGPSFVSENSSFSNPPNTLEPDFKPEEFKLPFRL